MSTDPLLPEEDARALVEFIESKVHHFLWNEPARRQEASDLVQEVLLRVMSRIRQYDPRRATLRTFVARIAESALLDEARRRSAAKRNPFRESFSLDGRFRGQGDSANRGTPDVKDSDARESERLRDLKIDLAEALSALPADLRQLAEDLREWTPAEAAERAGVHRGTVHRRLASIRRRWEDGTLRDYLDS